jgi:uncharacterized membrane protein
MLNFAVLLQLIGVVVLFTGHGVAVGIIFLVAGGFLYRREIKRKRAGGVQSQSRSAGLPDANEA